MMASRKEQKERARQARLEAERAAAARMVRARRLRIAGGIVGVGVAVVVAVAVSGGGGRSNVGSQSGGQLGFEGVPIQQGAVLASADTTQTGTVDGIACGSTEQLAYHIHAHLAVYVNGIPRAVPAGIGIPGSTVQQTAQGPEAAGGQCIYWLHTHAPDGVIHIESPTQQIYSLGEFFDEWHQPLGVDRVASAAGPVTAYVNGKRWLKDPRAIALKPHTVIQLDVGSPIKPFQSLSWSGTQL